MKPSEGFTPSEFVRMGIGFRVDPAYHSTNWESWSFNDVLIGIANGGIDSPQAIGGTAADESAAIMERLEDGALKDLAEACYCHAPENDEPVCIYCGIRADVIAAVEGDRANG